MTHSDRDGNEHPADAWGLHGGPHETWGVPAGLPLHEPTDRDGDNVPSGEERRTVCAKCGQFLGGFHKHCDGEWVEEVRTVTPWRRVPHEHQWVRHQNVTSRGYRLPAYEACSCGNARPVEEWA